MYYMDAILHLNITLGIDRLWILNQQVDQILVQNII